MTGQIERIRIFIQVAEQRSFAAAARQLNISRSVATRSVGELEAELGVQLLVRTTRSVALTGAGEVYLQRTRAIAGDLQRANEYVREQQNTLKGILRVSAPLSFGLRILPDVIAQFRKLHPQIELKLDLTDQFVDILSDNYDMALRISGPPSDKSTIWRKICVVPRVLAVSSAYLERRGVPKQPRDLTRHECLGYSNFAGGNELVLHHPNSARTETVLANHPFHCNSGDMILEMVLRDEGFALLPLFMVNDAIKSGLVKTALDNWRAPQIWLTAYYPPYDILPAKVQRFTNFFENFVAKSAALFDTDQIR